MRDLPVPGQLVVRRLLALALLLAIAVPAAGQRAATPQACAPVASIPFATPPPFETTSLRFDSGGVELGGCLYRPQGLARFPVVVLVAGSDGAPTAASIYSVIHAKAFA